MTVIPLGVLSPTALQIQSNETEYEPDELSDDLSDELSNDLSDELSDDLSDELSEHSDDELSGGELSDEIWRLPGERDLATSRRVSMILTLLPTRFNDSGEI
ncbi:hypothetical protein Rs2_37718 [Raphanus sativus]|nr:hypothetical protein Rs2_37718 [Raphanus sativus]